MKLFPALLLIACLFHNNSYRYYFFSIYYPIIFLFIKAKLFYCLRYVEAYHSVILIQHSLTKAFGLINPNAYNANAYNQATFTQKAGHEKQL